MTWQRKMAEHNGWNALFWCNHDQPRIVSRLGDTDRYWKESAKMLGTCIHLLRGTPYIFQGEELGMTNPGYNKIEEYRDVESINYYHIMLQEGKTEEEALEVLRQRSRDNGRSPMQWNSGEYAGFSDREPWIGIPANHTLINVEDEDGDPDSILNYYRKLTALRKRYPIIQEGMIEFLYEDQEEVFAYRRTRNGQELIVLNNFFGEEVTLQKELSHAGYRRLIGNYPQEDSGTMLRTLRPYESIAFIKE